MKTSEKILLSAAVAAFLTVICWMFLSVTKPESQPQPVVGSVEKASEYRATTTNTQALFSNYWVIREGTDYSGSPTTTPGVLGSVIITTTGTSPMCFYNATSTRTNAEWATSTIACFPASPVVGTYTFDATFSKGLLIEFTGSPTATSRASTTITYRLNQLP